MPGPETQTRSQAVTHQIRRLIMNGRFGPGSRLHELPLTELTGASRTPVRAALSELAKEGMVTYFPNRGYEVRQFSLEDIIDAYRTRAVLEGLACRMAAEKGLDPGEDNALADAVSAVDAILEPGVLRDRDRETWQRWNIVFHETIARASGSASLPKALAVVTNIPMISNSLMSWYDYDTVRRLHDHHRRIYDMIRHGRPDRAEAVMREHIEEAIDFIRDVYASSEQAGEPGDATVDGEASA